MKRLVNFIATAIILIGINSCSGNNNTNTQSAEKAVPQKEQVLEMNSDTLYARILSNIVESVTQKREKIDSLALTVISETQEFLQEVEAGENEDAINTGKKLIGELDILLTKNPDAALIPIDVQFKVDEVVTDIETVRDIVKTSKKAFNDGYYQVARDLLEGLKSEIVVTTYNIPTATYPIAIKDAVMLMEDGKTDLAKYVLQNVFGTIVIQDITLPLPVLKAQQMILEAQKIDAKDHENVDKVLNLLANANYQLELAEEMGYGKKNKDFANLYNLIKELEKSVKSKSDSGSKFEKLLDDLSKFNNKYFPLF